MRKIGDGMTKHEYEELMQIVKDVENREMTRSPANIMMPTHEGIYSENIHLGQMIVALRLKEALLEMKPKEYRPPALKHHIQVNLTLTDDGVVIMNNFMTRPA